MAGSPRIIAADIIGAVDLDWPMLRSILSRVEPSEVTIRVGPGWFRLIWGRHIAAIALPWGIYVRPHVMARLRADEELWRNARLIVHELVHIEQWRRFGGPRLVIRYSTDYLRGLIRTGSHWQAYRAVRTEVEARAAVRLVAGTT